MYSSSSMPQSSQMYSSPPMQQGPPIYSSPPMPQGPPMYSSSPISQGPPMYSSPPMSQPPPTAQFYPTNSIDMSPQNYGYKSALELELFYRGMSAGAPKKEEPQKLILPWSDIPEKQPLVVNRYNILVLKNEDTLQHRVICRDEHKKLKKTWEVERGGSLELPMNTFKKGAYTFESRYRQPQRQNGHGHKHRTKTIRVQVQ